MSRVQFFLCILLLIKAIISAPLEPLPLPGSARPGMPTGNVSRESTVHPSSNWTEAATGNVVSAQQPLALQSRSDTGILLPTAAGSAPVNLVQYPATPVIPQLPYGFGTNSQLFSQFYWEYAHDQAQQVLIFGPYFTVVAYKRIYGYRHGPYYGYGIFWDVPPFSGFGLVREGFGVNVAADTLALLMQYLGQKRASEGRALAS